MESYSVYVIHFPTPSKAYVGMSGDFENRKKLHLREGKKGLNNPMYGKPSHRRRPVIVEGKYYATIHEAADKGPCSVKTLYKWLKEGKAVYAALD